MAGLAYPHWEPSPFHTPATEQFQRRRRCLRPSGPSFQLSPRPLSPPAFASRQPPIQAQQYLSLTACRWADAACPRLEQNDNTRPSRGHLHVVPEVTHLLISCAPFQNDLSVEQKKCSPTPNMPISSDALAKPSNCSVVWCAVSKLLLFLRPPANQLTLRDRHIQQERHSSLLGIEPGFRANLVILPNPCLIEPNCYDLH